MYFEEKKFTIYAIRCKQNGKLYIGRTTRLDNRIKSHFCELKTERHNNKLLVEDYKKFGRENFEVYVLEENVPYSKRGKEYEYMRKYNSFDKEFGYNKGDIKKKEVSKIEYIYELPPNLYKNN